MLPTEVTAPRSLRTRSSGSLGAHQPEIVLERAPAAAPCASPEGPNWLSSIGPEAWRCKCARRHRWSRCSLAWIVEIASHCPTARCPEPPPGPVLAQQPPQPAGPAGALDRFTRGDSSSSLQATSSNTQARHTRPGRIHPAAGGGWIHPPSTAAVGAHQPKYQRVPGLLLRCRTSPSGGLCHPQDASAGSPARPSGDQPVAATASVALPFVTGRAVEAITRHQGLGAARRLHHRPGPCLCPSGDHPQPAQRAGQQRHLQCATSAPFVTVTKQITAPA